MSTPIPDKRETVTKFASIGEVLLILDARQPGVRVPERLRGERALRLKFSYRYDTGGLVADDQSVRQCLRFGGETFLCIIPWAAVIAAVSVPTSLGCAWGAPPEPKPPHRDHLYLVN